MQKCILVSVKEHKKILKKISGKVGRVLEGEEKEMQTQTYLCSSASSNLPFQHAVQCIFTVFTIKLLHEKLEDNEFPHSAQQQRT